MKKVIMLLAFMLFFTTPVMAADTQISRISGEDRFDVARNVYEQGWSSANTVVLANYKAFADALAAAPLAYKHNAPIFLTESNHLTDKTRTKLESIHPSKVYIVGGSGSISDRVFREVDSLSGSVQRIGGSDRFDVAANIAREMGSTNNAVIANGMVFADALSIAPYAARHGYPILLTEDTTLPQTTSNTLKALGINDTIIVGGTGSVGQGVANDLPSPMRIGGSDRFEVSSNIVKQLNWNPSKAYVATGLTFADALTGSVLAAKQNAPILLTMPSDVSNSIEDIIHHKDLNHFVILGGTGSVSTNVNSQLNHMTQLTGKLIVLDPGHGDHDSGAIGNGLYEKNVVLDVGIKTRDKLEAVGANIIMTRDNDTFVELSDRVKIANSAGADSFISIHANAFTSSSVNGTESYWDSTYKARESEELAAEIQPRLINRLNTDDRGVKHYDYYVLRHTLMPSVLLELGFITNPEDAAKLASEWYRGQAAKAILDGVLAYYN
ncbi:cell wall-binding repeat-containing protein [Pseudalkalibacillus decolorationis]|uniref:cell wall-binding repeat-containing protein n=1 Tax=Pseudalkalibacillus decolorationis TaxID=163879 RepID=UPI00214822A6|nr:cell wall-binding repeat-containing protein [Pseudalkalibacillus decolorationis]